MRNGRDLFVCNELKLQRNRVITSCLGTTGCYSKLWAPAIFFPAADILCLVIIFAMLMRLHFTASFSHNHGLSSAIYILPFSRFLFHQKNFSSPRYVPLTTFYSPTLFWVEQSSSLIGPVFTLPCLTESSFLEFSNPDTHLGVGKRPAIKLIEQNEKCYPTGWVKAVQLICSSEEEDEELELCAWHYQAFPRSSHQVHHRLTSWSFVCLVLQEMSEEGETPKCCGSRNHGTVSTYLPG